MCLKTSVQIERRATTLSSKLFARATLLYHAYYVGYAWRAIFEIIRLVVLSDRSQNVLQRGCTASPRVRDILIPIASDVYLESMPRKLLQGLRCSVKNPVLQAIFAYCAAKWQRH